MPKFISQNRFAYIICTLAGAGYLPKAPGTFASVIAAVFYFALNPEWLVLSIWIIVALTLGLIFIGQVEQTSIKDPSFIVIDELTGQWLTFLFLPKNDLLIIISGIILFRIFDIRKPFGINKIQNLPSGWGVMLDDILAAVYANIILQILIYIEVF